MSNKERNTQAHERIVEILTASGGPMTMPEIVEHTMFRPMNASSRSLGQWLNHMVRTGVLAKRGRGSRKATYTMAAPKMPRASHKVAAPESVIIRFDKSGNFRSVQAPAGVAIAMEIVA